MKKMNCPKCQTEMIPFSVAWGEEKGTMMFCYTCGTRVPIKVNQIEDEGEITEVETGGVKEIEQENEMMESKMDKTGEIEYNYFIVDVRNDSKICAIAPDIAMAEKKLNSLIKDDPNQFVVIFGKIVDTITEKKITVRLSK
jgi:transcription elongation factor Elf1